MYKRQASIINDAIKANASDIHIDPTDEGADVRYRIDGVLHCVKQLPADGRDALVARFKIMADIPLTRSGMPQDGRILVRIDDRDYDLRVTTVPVMCGEKITMRILNKNFSTIRLDQLDFLPEQLEKVRELLHQRNGIIISTGPVASGKTTLLYSMVMDLIKPEINIMTIEDPVEWQINGLKQVQVDRKAGLTFPAAMRAIMRHDPDIIMVGEIGDAETMKLCAYAAMTGHLVLSQMLTPDTLSVPQNIAAYGVDPWLIGSSLIGVVGSVLLRKNCADCMEEYTPSDEALEFLGLKDLAGKKKFYHGVGCEKCKQSGFRGRVQLHEVLPIDRQLGRLISSGQTDPGVLLNHATSKGFITMIEDAKRRILKGETTAEEAFLMLMMR